MTGLESALSLVVPLVLIVAVGAGFFDWLDRLAHVGLGEREDLSRPSQDATAGDLSLGRGQLPSRSPSSSGVCFACGKWAEKRYGGEGRYHVVCLDCWLNADASSVEETSPTQEVDPALDSYSRRVIGRPDDNRPRSTK